MIFEGLKIEFWVLFQIIIDVILIVLIFRLIRNMRIRLQKDVSRETSKKVMDMIEPLLSQANHVATAFEKQLREKNHLINTLNEKLDARIISLNLLLNRTEAIHMAEPADPESTSFHVYDQQESIIKLYHTGKSSSEIAKILSLPKGEIDLVLDLKKKLIELQ
ncbi:MAG: hypothetical protein C4522_18380 [Desulfobacteraceae bacterium]|nr:MAG: hypothetical protein C4522_18380 [Desulfobacteraceae bacterium]